MFASSLADTPATMQSWSIDAPMKPYQTQSGHLPIDYAKLIGPEIQLPRQIEQCDAPVDCEFDFVVDLEFKI